MRCRGASLLLAHLLVAAVLAAACRERDAAGGPALALTHVTLVDVAAGTLLPERTVVVQGDRLLAAGPGRTVAVPAGARVVDGRGRFLIPGLWDHHVHISAPDRVLPLFLAHGVTGVRDMGNAPLVFRWREEVERGRRLGPRIVACGPIVDGPQPSAAAYTFVVAGPEDGRRVVRRLARLGADCVKVYDEVPRAAYHAVAEEARRRGLPLVGHVPNAVTLAEAAAAGQATNEHLGGLLEAGSREAGALRHALLHAPPPARWEDIPDRIAARGERALATWDAATAGRLFRALASGGMAQVPTLVAKRVQSRIDEIAEAPDPRLRWVSQYDRSWWRPARNYLFRYRTPAYLAYRHRAYARELALVGELHRAGVGILAGTDLGTPWIYPGASLHDELELLVEAGLSPRAALAAATTPPAGIETTAGDWVLLAADPLADIRNVRKIEGVAVRGRWLDRAALDRLLAAAAQTVTSGIAEPAGRER